MDQWFYYLIAGCIISFFLGTIFSKKTVRVSASDILSAYLEEELTILVSKLMSLKAEDMEGKREMTQLLQQKISQARTLHNRLLKGTFESVHQKALAQVAFLTWDTYDE